MRCRVNLFISLSLILGFITPSHAHRNPFRHQHQACRYITQNVDFYQRIVQDQKEHIQKIGIRFAAWERAGSTWGMANGSVLNASQFPNIKLSIKGDPSKSNKLTLVVEKNGNAIRSIDVPWNPKHYVTSNITTELPLLRSVVLNDEFINSLPENLKNDFLLRREASELVNARVALAIMEDTAPFSEHFRKNTENFQETLEEFLRIQKTLPVMRGETPLSAISDLHSYLGPPSELLETIYPEYSFYRTIVDNTETQWLLTKDEVDLNKALPLAVSHLLLSLKENVTFYQGKRVYGMPFASSVSIQGKKSSIHLHHLDIDAMKELNRNTINPRMAIAPASQWHSAHQQIQKYISKVYLSELGISVREMNALNRFVQKNEDRIQYLFLSEEAPILGKPVRNKSAFKNSIQPHDLDDFQRGKMLDRFNVKGCFGILTVSNENQKFSMEAYAGIRPKYTPGERVVELIRFGMDEEIRHYGPRMAFQVSSYLINSQLIDRVTLITNASYGRELIERFGFRKVQVKDWGSGKEDWLLEITPDDFIQKSLSKLLRDS